jgi:predicted type IV restriction endonuclease
MTIKAVEETIHHVRGWMDDDDGYWEYLDSNEMSTRYVLIDPIIRALGWDTGDLYHCVVEFKKSGQADYALFDTEGDLAVIIESKNTGYRNLNLLRNNPEAPEQQLAQYVDQSTAKAGVLTNGLIWRLYDLDNARRKLANQLVEPVIDIYQDNAKISQRYIREAAKTLHVNLGAHLFGWPIT